MTTYFGVFTRGEKVILDKGFTNACVVEVVSQGHLVTKVKDGGMVWNVLSGRLSKIPEAFQPKEAGNELP